MCKLGRKCLGCGETTADPENSDLRVAGYIGFIEFGVFIETLDVSTEIPGVSTEIPGVSIEIAGVYTASQYF